MKQKNGFSLVELLIVIAIISVLASMLLPTLQSAVAQAKHTRWKAQLASLRADGDVVLIYDFEDRPQARRLANSAAAIDFRGAYEPKRLDGALIGTPGPLWTEGRWGPKGALAFPNAGTPFVNAERHRAVSFGAKQNFSIGIWARIPEPTAEIATPNGGTLIATTGLGTGAYGFRIAVWAGGSPARPTGGQAYLASATSVNCPFTLPPSNDWFHIIASYDRANKLTVYVNGKQAGTVSIAAATGNIDADPVHTHTLMTGYGTQGAFRGMMDEVVIWQRALTADEAAGFYAAGRP